MKLSIVFLSVAAVFLAGCSRPVKETIIERPVYVTTPAPATTTVVTPSAAAGATSAGCLYASQNYSHGAVSCQDRTEYKCDAGVWRRTFAAC